MATVARSPHRNNSWEIMMNPEDIGISITIFCGINSNLQNQLRKNNDQMEPT